MLKIFNGGNEGLLIKRFKDLTLNHTSTTLSKKMQFDTFKAAEPIYNIKKKPQKNNFKPYAFCNLETVLKYFKVF